jgi:predicted transcriptional regulator
LSDRFNDVESDFTFTNLADLIAAFQADIARWNDENSDACFAVAWDTGKAPQSARISFATPELLWKVLTAKRWAILKVLCGAGPRSIREVARRDDLRSVEDHRDVKAVHGDITALLAAGILDRTAAGEIEFPFDAVKVEFLLQAA